MDSISFSLKVDSITNAFSYRTDLGRNFKMTVFYFKSLENPESINYFYISIPICQFIHIDCQSFVNLFASISVITAKIDNS